METGEKTMNEEKTSGGNCAVSVPVKDLSHAAKQALAEAADLIEKLRAEIEDLRSDRDILNIMGEVGFIGTMDKGEEIERLQAANEKMAIGVNHIANWRTDKWPDYGTDCMAALERLGAGREYDMWCCWNAAMCARDELEGRVR